MSINNIQLRVFVKNEDEDELRIKTAFIGLFPFDIEKEKIIIEEKKAKGFNEKQIKIFQANLNKKKHIDEFLAQLLEMLSKKDKNKILSQSESRLDEQNHFFIRLDKGALCGGNCCLTETGNCVHIMMNIVTYPKDRNKALDFVREIFS